MDPKYDAGAHSRLDIPGKVMAYEALGKVRAEWLTVRTPSPPSVTYPLRMGTL